MPDNTKLKVSELSSGCLKGVSPLTIEKSKTAALSSSIKVSIPWVGSLLIYAHSSTSSTPLPLLSILISKIGISATPFKLTSSCCVGVKYSSLAFTTTLLLLVILALSFTTPCTVISKSTLLSGVGFNCTLAISA